MSIPPITQNSSTHSSPIHKNPAVKNNHVSDLSTSILNNYIQMVSTKSLTEYQLEVIYKNDHFFYGYGLEKMSDEEFDRYSIGLIQILCKEELSETSINRMHYIFNASFSDKQLCRHLSNLSKFIYILESRSRFDLKIPLSLNIDPQKLIDEHLSLLTLDKMIKASQWAEANYEDNATFYDHLWKFIELENERDDKIVLVGNKSSMGIDFFSDFRNWIISNEIISRETPTSLYEASAVNAAIQSKYLQTPGSISMGLALIAGPFALLSYCIAPLQSIITKVYMACLDAPMSLYPLRDSRTESFSSNQTFVGREDIIREIVQAWNDGQHPLLIGVPGVGKTTILEELSRMIAQGEIPALKGKVVFMGSAAELATKNPMGPPHIQRVIKAILPYKENVVLALDEFHAFFLANDKPISTYVSRTALDIKKSDSIRYGLFTTTLEDYDKYIKGDESIGRRIRPIHIKALEKDNLLILLHHEVKDVSRHFTITSKAMELIYDQTNGKQNESRLLLHKIIRSAESFNSTHPCYVEKQVKVSEIAKNKLLRNNSNLFLKESNELSDKIHQGNIELEKIQKKCDIQDKRKNMLHWLQDQRTVLSQQTTLAAKKIWKLAYDFSKDKKVLGSSILKDSEFVKRNHQTLNQFVFHRYFKQPNLVQFVSDYAEVFGLIDKIDTAQMIPLLANTEPMKMLSCIQENRKGEALDKMPFIFTKALNLPVVPQKGIRVPLKNLGNSCWLNAALKFIAASTYYDQMLLKDAPKGKERLHGLLGDTITSLRQGNEVNENQLLALMREIRRVFPEYREDRQHDAYAFILTLCRKGLEWDVVMPLDVETLEKTNQLQIYPRIGAQYNPSSKLPSGLGKKLAEDNFMTMVDVDIGADSEDDIDILKQIEEPRSVEVKPDIISEKVAQKSGNKDKNHKFLATSHFTTLPDVIMMNIKRFHQDKDGVKKKINNMIKLDKKGFITLTRYKAVDDSSMKKEEECQYRIGASISHIGDNIESGHYIFDERTSDDQFIRHSDDKLVSITQTDFGKLGYVVRLDKVEKAPTNWLNPMNLFRR